MKCPYCGNLGDKVVDSRESKEGDVIRRRRQCLTCHKRFTSRERIEDIEYRVVKKDGNREAFQRYLRHYITEVKRTHPEFQFCSNWAFSDHMPEPVCAPVDFLSGDYSPQDSVNSARFSARYLARQGKPWDLMAWSFARVPGTPGHTQK